MTHHRGALIVLEGCDRAGKSTQCQMLIEELTRRRLPVKLLKFPDRTTPIGQSIHAYLQQTQEMDDHAIHLLFSANRWEVTAEMKRLLVEEKCSLICDRYAFSGVAFSAAKGLPLSWCKATDQGLLVPDQTIFMDLPVEVMKERSGFGEERYEKHEFQLQVRQQFHQLAKDEGVSGRSWTVIFIGLLCLNHVNDRALM